MKNYKLNFLLIICLLTAIMACQKLIPKAPANNEILDGPVEGLTSEEKKKFLDGDKAFNGDIFTSQTGLGPYFVATSCGGCHAGDGKGHPSTTLTRFGQSDTNGNSYLNFGGPQLQNRAIPGYTPESIPSGAPSSKFTPPANSGLGFLEALTDAQILINADPNDADGDGISGVPNYINPPSYFHPQPHHIPSNGKYIGRFGKKAGAIDLIQQTANAYVQDMGITSDYNPNEPAINGIQGNYGDPVPDPEIPLNKLLNVVFYLRTLKAPEPRNTGSSDHQLGKKIFGQIGCEKCHKENWTSGISSINAISNKAFSPYTDLLLHDMGSGLDDGYTEGKAKSYEWKTPALWGLGLSKKSQGGQYYLLHDGRARSIEEAIDLHGGEGQKSRNQFIALSEQDKEALVKFLEDL